MRPRIADFFSDQDLRRIRDAVRSAESATSAEIVPYIVDRSDRYDEAVWRAGLLSALAVLGGIWMIRVLTELWIPPGLSGVVLAVLGVSSLSMLLVRRSPTLIRWFAGKETMERRCNQRAREAFLAEEVFATRGRTGILIFMSLLEHHVEVLGDSGISARVRQEEWEALARTVIGNVRTGNAAEGMLLAIAKGGELLQRLSGTPDDRNELTDDPRTGTT